LPRSATGQSISNYVDVLTGPKGEGEFHGAEHMYFIVVDCGRTECSAATFVRRFAASAAVPA
jgi:L-lactate dehydrogenase complex protein LldF